MLGDMRAELESGSGVGAHRRHSRQVTALQSTLHSTTVPQSDSKVRYITSLKRGDMGIRGKIH